MLDISDGLREWASEILEDTDGVESLVDNGCGLTGLYVNGKGSPVATMEEICESDGTGFVVLNCSKDDSIEDVADKIIDEVRAANPVGEECVVFMRNLDFNFLDDLADVVLERADADISCSIAMYHIEWVPLYM